MGVFDVDKKIPIETLLNMDNWIPIQSIFNARPFEACLYWQQVSITRYCKKIAKLEYGREQEGNFFIDLEFWPKGYKYVNKQDRYFTLKKPLLKIGIRHHYSGSDIGYMRDFCIRPKDDDESLRAMYDIQNVMYKDVDLFIKKYKGVNVF